MERIMSILIADDEWAKKLNQFIEPVEIRAPDGKRLGLFTPAKLNMHPPEPKISADEVTRRLMDPNGKWFTAEEVESKLKKLRCLS
jgi:hypothetical protein